MKTLTEREAVLRERKAYVAAKLGVPLRAHYGYGDYYCRAHLEIEAAEKFPLPVTPRVAEVTWRSGRRMDYRFNNGVLEAKLPHKSHWSTAEHTADSVRALADILANPNEGDA